VKAGRSFLLLGFLATLHAAVPCPTPRDLSPGASLEALAASDLGNSRYAIAIALATNARSGDGFTYIASPDDLSNVKRVCIPSKTEARELTRSWVVYDRAVAQARLPRAAAVGKTLLTIPPGQPVGVVAWVRKDQADRLKTASGVWMKAAAAETWVTIEPHLQDFCRAFIRDHGPNEAKLTARLEQRLGLSPASSKAYFVRMRLDQPGPDAIFRPCSDSSAAEANCSAGGPAKASAEYHQWFRQQYYSSYGQSLISEFPWTALGYTFDWGSPAQHTGESEFVIRKDANIEILDVVPTAKYCAP
jgi:hypothetical protein